jgi:hypothetical protein
MFLEPVRGRVREGWDGPEGVLVEGANGPGTKTVPQDSPTPCGACAARGLAQSLFHQTGKVPEAEAVQEGCGIFCAGGLYPYCPGAAGDEVEEVV